MDSMISVFLVVSTVSADTVFVSVEEARSLLAQDAAVLDARGVGAFAGGHLPGSAPLDWTALRDSGGDVGHLSSDTDKLQRALRSVGVSAGPVIVYDAGRSGWGEAGRIWWTLSYLGHDAVYILDGGLGAWEAAGQPVSTAPAAPGPGSFVARPEPGLRAALPEVSACVSSGCDVVFWDTREAREYGGATPYGEARGGHLPGAVGLHYKDLLDAQGRLRPEAELRSLLEGAGITPEKRVVPYCTGGVRSALAVAVLTELGYGDVANYDGSMWEWSADPARPLE